LSLSVLAGAPWGADAVYVLLIGWIGPMVNGPLCHIGIRLIAAMVRGDEDQTRPGELLVSPLSWAPKTSSAHTNSSRAWSALFARSKAVDLEIQTIGHYLERRVRAHVLLAMLAYYVEWHLREAWAPLLFKDEQPPVAADPVSKALPSEQAQRKASHQRTDDGTVVHSFKTLLGELATRARATIRIAQTEVTFTRLVQPTPIVERALRLVEQLAVAP
jgi:hypothetical protein